MIKLMILELKDNKGNGNKARNPNKSFTNYKKIDRNNP
jgi:hypothetical protein